MRTVLAVLFGLGAAIAADKRTPENSEALLQRIRERAAAHLAQLPNYTCHEVIERLLRRGTNWNRLDTVDIEVVFVGRQEFFARPGEKRFEERLIERVVQHGTIGSGAFGSQADVLFSQGVADFRYVGTAKKDGHRTYRYEFTVRFEKSQFLVKHDNEQGVVPYGGNVWVDADTLDLVRIDLQVKQIPSRIGVRWIEEFMHYEVMRIGGSDFLLPRKSELTATDDSGNYSLNVVKLESCREFRGDSTIKYGAASEGSDGNPRPDH